MAAARSFLFAPANRPDIFAKLEGSGADIICIDLEDAVPPDAKDAARANALGWIAAPAPGPRRAVRINPLSTRHGLADLHALSAVADSAALIVMPKVEEAAEPRLTAAALEEGGTGAGLMALIESARGLQNADAIAASTQRMEYLLFGAVDLSAELGAEIAPEPLLYARARVVLAARAAGITAMDVPCLDFRNQQSVADEARAAKAMGFGGKAAIHPSNIETINGVFSPTQEQIDAALRMIAAYEDSPNGLVVIDGKLIEKPVIRSMQRVIEAARAAGLTP